MFASLFPKRLPRLLTVAGIRPILKHMFSLLVYFRFYAPIVWFYVRIIREVGGKPGLPTILAITIERFRDDHIHLVDTGEFRVLGLPTEWIAILCSQFYAPGMGRGRYFPEKDDAIARAQQKYRNFLSEFLPRLYGKLGIDCVISASIDYAQDYDWGAVSHELGIPYIVFHKENLVGSTGMAELFENWGRRLGSFKGSHVVVHNETVRQLFLKSGYVRHDQISNLGCIRMDKFLKSIKSGTFSTTGRDRPLVAFFSFPIGIGLDLFFGGGRAWPNPSDGIGFFEAFRQAHVAIAQLAIERPDVDFLIKPKWGGSWIKKIQNVFSDVGIDETELSNLTISLDMPAQDVISDASVVASYGSTVVLEAAIAGKPVVVPFIAEMQEQRYKDLIFLHDQMEQIFDVAQDDNQFKNLIRHRLANPVIEESCMDERRKIFDSLVSRVDGKATIRYIELLKSMINRPDANTPNQNNLR